MTDTYENVKIQAPQIIARLINGLDALIFLWLSFYPKP
jgi:hypothetical protein